MADLKGGDGIRWGKANEVGEGKGGEGMDRILGDELRLKKMGKKIILCILLFLKR